MNKQHSFYWHDFETFGTDPKRDWPSQFAGVRSDADFNIIGKPLVIYCKPPKDALPQPEACLVTGISPQKALAEGLHEKDFIKIIHQEMSASDTCVVGYNNIRFDDEVTRNTLYRNFYDPYQREYMNRNSRWDLIDLVRMTYALRPEGITWPTDDKGKPSFRLELLSQANNIEHISAHDALSDVIATIELAKLIKHHQPRLFQYIFELRRKQKVFERLNLAKQNAVVHISGKYPTTQSCLALVVPLYEEPGNANGIVVCDLDKDPSMLLDLTSDEIQHRLFSKSVDLPDNTERPPIKTIHANKCPALAPSTVLREQDIERLNLNMHTIEQRRLFVLKHQKELQQKIKAVLASHEFTESSDPDLMLYSGGFFNQGDKQKMQSLITMNAQQLSDAQHNLNFQDARIAEMLFRYRARNFHDSLSEEENLTWKLYCQKKLAGELPNCSLSMQSFNETLQQLKQKHQNDIKTLTLLDELSSYGQSLMV